MLVLSRKPGERILIGDGVAITVVRVGPNNVRLGIDAPREMNIVREELVVDLVDLSVTQTQSTETAPEVA